MRAPLFVLFLFLGVALTGCLGDADEPPVDPDDPAATQWAEAALPFGEGHDHLDRSHHASSTPNFEVVGYDPLITEFHGHTSGSYFCGDVATDGERNIGVVISFDSEVTIVLVDLTDPERPVKLGELAIENSAEYDAAITPDGHFVTIAMSRPPTPSTGQALGDAGGAALRLQAPVSATFTDRCGRTFVGPAAAVPNGPSVVLVDVRDPMEPTIVDVVPQPILGVHSVFATEIDGRNYVLSSVTNLAHYASYFTVLEIVEGVDGPALEVLGVFNAESPTTNEQPVPLVSPDPGGVNPDSATGTVFSQVGRNGHVDGWIAKHPVTNEILVYLAAWNGGLHILRLEGKGELEPIETWSDYDPSAGAAMTGQVHGAYPLPELRDGKHYTIIGQEVTSRPANRPTGQVIVLDTTDPANPTAVARWTLPVDVQFDDGLIFSTHYTSVIGDTMFVAMYHGGVWAVDISDLTVEELPSIGVFLPDRESPKPAGAGVRVPAWSPTVLDTVPLPTGELAVYDAPSGVYTVRFDANAPMPSPEPWTADKWL